MHAYHGNQLDCVAWLSAVEKLSYREDDAIESTDVLYVFVPFIISALFSCSISSRISGPGPKTEEPPPPPAYYI